MFSPNGSYGRVKCSELNAEVEICGDGSYFQRLFKESCSLLKRYVVSTNGKWFGLHFAAPNGEVCGGCVINLETNETYPLPRRFLRLALTGIADDGLLVGLCQDFRDPVCRAFVFDPASVEIKLLPADPGKIFLHHIFPNGDVLGTLVRGRRAYGSKTVGASVTGNSERPSEEFPANPLFDHALSKCPSSAEAGITAIHCIWQRSIDGSTYRLRYLHPDLLAERIIPYVDNRLLLATRAPEFGLQISFEVFDGKESTSFAQPLAGSSVELMSTHADGSVFGRLAITSDQAVPLRSEVLIFIPRELRDHQRKSVVLNFLWQAPTSSYCWIGADFDFFVSNVSSNARYLVGWQPVNDGRGCTPILVEEDGAVDIARAFKADDWAIEHAHVIDDGTLLCLASRGTQRSFPLMPIRVRDRQA